MKIKGIKFPNGPVEVEYDVHRPLSWLLTADFQAIIIATADDDTALAPIKITVPAGFETDLASVPRPLWDFFPPFGKYTAAAVLHDYLYHTGGGPLTWDRPTCDTIFLAAIRELGMGLMTRGLMYAGVRAFGAGAYKTRCAPCNTAMAVRPASYDYEAQQYVCPTCGSKKDVK